MTYTVAWHMAHNMMLLKGKQAASAAETVCAGIGLRAWCFLKNSLPSQHQAVQQQHCRKHQHRAVQGEAGCLCSCKWL